MALFDLRRRRICLRIVYDGPSGAGKSANVRSLARLFAPQLVSGLYSAGEVEGRTLYFDWLQILGGAACGFPLLCQVVAVPGHVALDARRRYLLSTADAVVVVCDSTVEGVARTQAMLASSNGVASIIQANQQDRAGAAGATDVRAALARTEVPAFEAVASESIGVMATFVAAVREVTRRLQAQHEETGLRLPMLAVPEAGDVLHALDALPLDPAAVAELLLETCLLPRRAGSESARE